MNDIEQIKKLKARYFRALDAQDWELYASVFAPDVVVDTTRAVGGRCVKYIAPATAASATSTPKAMRVRFDMECPF